MSRASLLRRAWRGIKYRGYGQGWLNPASRRLFQASAPDLGEAQARIVEEIRRDGFARVDVRDLLGGSLWEDAAAEGRTFAGSERVLSGIESYRAKAEKRGKDYIVHLREPHPSLPPEDSWLRLGLSPIVLDTVNSYLGLWSKLIYTDVWYTIPSPGSREAVASQRWHRDPEDRKLIKVFLYLSEVDEGAGPLEYVRGSHGLGPHARLWPTPDVATASYPPEGTVEARIPAADRVACTGPAGTLIFCDTYGLHRGGLATERARVLATWAYVTPASIFARRFEVSWLPGSSGFGRAAEYAVR